MAGFTRRNFVATGGALLATKSFAESANVNAETTTEQDNDVTGLVRHNISSFRALDWRPYFDTLKNGAILVDISSRALHFWSQDEKTYRLYPTSVPMTEDLTRRGYTKIIKKVEGPSWRPTPAMR